MPAFDLLRFTTAGSVDDGKSTLIGRLLYDSKAIFEDQLEAVEASSKRRGDERVNLALLTDGLKAEREQGITIDVAYRYFATPNRKFIIADTPGHVQYTRNMVTGASTANLAVILVDARNGVVEQTHRHTAIAHLLGIRHLLVAINKMDLVDFSEARYAEIQAAYTAFAQPLGVPDIQFVPISALLGDNVVTRSEQTPWYNGPTFLEFLETVEIAEDYNLEIPRLPVQWVIRPQSDQYPDYRGYAGKVAGGVFRVGDEVEVLPSGLRSSITKIHCGPDDLAEARPPLSVAITLADNIDISRGDLITVPGAAPEPQQVFDGYVCWLSPSPLQPRGKYGLRHTTREVQCIVEDVRFRLDVDTLGEQEEATSLGLNEIGRVTLRTSQPLFLDPYTTNRATGSFELYDAFTNEVVAAGMALGT